MSYKNVHLIPDHYYHIYNKAVAENLLFFEDKNYPFFISKIKKYLPDSATILGYCLMPNHYHLIIRIEAPGFPASMHKLALSYAVSINRYYKRKGHIFSGPYQRKLIMDLPYLLHLSRYIHLNPVKAGIVSKAEDWKYSSYRVYIGTRGPDFINPEIILDMVSGGQTNSLIEKQIDYQEFIEDWDFRYMEFKMNE